MPVARTTAAAASVVRTFARAARPQPAIASTSRALATSTRAAAESPSSPLPPAPRSAAASSSPAPAFSSRYPPGSGTHLYAPSPEAQRAYLASLLDAVGVPNPHLLDEYVAEKTLTHKSGVDKVAAYGRKMKRSEVQAIEREQAQERRAGHNEKFAFIGRRLLRLHLTQHLFSRLSSNPALLSTVLTSPSQIPLSLESILDTKTLGASVGKVWRLEDALKWREVRGQDGEMTGLWKCRGTGVEGVIGMVFATQGIDATNRVFQQLVLPHLALPITLERALAAAPEAAAETAGGRAAGAPNAQAAASA
ncbi:hypothetical protein JCM8202v2_004703 [Rhodotorula sphaerocarpa]